MNNQKSQYFVIGSTNAKLTENGWEPSGEIRVFGYYSLYLKALKAINNNAGDIHEYYYNYAFIFKGLEGYPQQMINVDNLVFVYDKEQNGFFETGKIDENTTISIEYNDNYFISLFEKIELDGKFIDMGKTCTGVCTSTLENAIDILKNQGEQIYQDGYKFAMIEKMEQGVFPCCFKEDRTLYEYNEDTNEFVPIEEPAEWNHIVNFALG